MNQNTNDHTYEFYRTRSVLKNSIKRTPSPLRTWFCQRHSLGTIEDIVISGFDAGLPFTRARKVQYDLYRDYRDEMWQLLVKHASDLTMPPLVYLSEYAESTDLYAVTCHAEYVYTLTRFTIEMLAREFYTENTNG